MESRIESRCTGRSHRASWLAARKFIGDVDQNYRYWRSAEARCSRRGPLVLALVDELILEIATEAAERAQQLSWTMEHILEEAVVEVGLEVADEASKDETRVQERAAAKKRRHECVSWIVDEVTGEEIRAITESGLRWWHQRVRERTETIKTGLSVYWAWERERRRSTESRGASLHRRGGGGRWRGRAGPQSVAQVGVGAGRVCCAARWRAKDDGAGFRLGSACVSQFDGAKWSPWRGGRGFLYWRRLRDAGRALRERG